MKIGLMQRVCAGYRVPFFDLLAQSNEGRLSLYAGMPRAEEMIDSSRRPQVAQFWPAKNLHLFSGKAYVCIQSDVLDWLKDYDPDVLIMEANQRYLMSPRAAGWMHQRNRPVIGWGLGTGKASRRLQQRALRRYEALITYSAAGAESYCAAGFPRERIFIACNAASARPCRPMPQRPADYFEGQPIVLFVGRLQERKRVDLLIRACAAQPRDRQPRLWIVGDGPVRAALEQTASEIYPRTEFFGAQYGEALQQYFDQADLFVLPGTGGLALQQAMACALPVVAAEADGTQADLVGQQNGTLIRPGDLTDLTETLSRLLSDPVQLRKMGEASFRIVDQEINLEAMVAVFQKAIRFALKNGARA